MYTGALLSELGSISSYFSAFLPRYSSVLKGKFELKAKNPLSPANTPWLRRLVSLSSTLLSPTSHTARSMLI